MSTKKKKKGKKPEPLSENYMRVLKESGFTKNPHKGITTPSSLGGKFRCNYCGAEDLYDNLMQTNCTYEYSPCEKCGGFPLCKVDCEEPTKGTTYISGFGRELDG